MTVAVTMRRQSARHNEKLRTDYLARKEKHLPRIKVMLAENCSQANIARITRTQLGFVSRVIKEEGLKKGGACNEVLY